MAQFKYFYYALGIAKILIIFELNLNLVERLPAEALIQNSNAPFAVNLLFIPMERAQKPF